MGIILSQDMYLNILSRALVKFDATIYLDSVSELLVDVYRMYVVFDVCYKFMLYLLIV